MNKTAKKTKFAHKRKFFLWFSLALIAILAVTLFEKSLKLPDLVYSVNPSKTTIYGKGASSRLTVSFDGQKIEGDVSSIKIGFWNRGSKTIKTGDVLTGIKISVDTSYPIYDAKIVRVVNDSSGLRLDLSSQKAGIIGLSWNTLKKGEGGVVQLIYGGNARLIPSITGAINGQGDIKMVETKNPWPLGGAKITAHTKFNWEAFLEIAMLLFIFFLFIGYCGYTMIQIIKIRHESDFQTVFIVEVITLLIFFASVWLVVYLVTQSHSSQAIPLDF